MFDKSLAVSFNTFNYVDTHRKTLYRTRLKPTLATPPLSVILQADESDDLPKSKRCSSSAKSNALLGQENTVGIIGGLSVDSTLNFLRKMVRLSSINGENSIPFVLCSDPALSTELQVHDKHIRSKSGKFQLDHTMVVENLRAKRSFLEKSGASCIVMPCHISHKWHNEVSESCSVPFLHIGECIAKELIDAKLKPLEAGSPTRIGVLGQDATLTAGFYQEKLQNEGFEVVIPDKATMEHTIIPAIEALNKKDMEGARNLLRIALQVLLVKAVNKIVLASDDIWDILPRDDPLLKKCIDPMDALARSTIKWAQTAKRCTRNKKNQVE